MVDILNPFAALPPEQALAQLNAAIAKAEVSQSYQIGDRKLMRGDLRWMYPERARLEAIVKAAVRGAPRFRRFVPL